MSDSSPSPAPPEPRKRRLVPESSDAIEVNGQRLVRAVRVEEEVEPPKPLTIDDIARKHLSPSVAQAIEENSEFFERLAGQEPPPPPIHDFAKRIEIVSDGDVIVPHPEADAEKRHDVMSMSPIIGTADAPDFLQSAKPETIFDLFSMFPLDGDNWWIYVERKTPKTHSGTPCAGVLRPVIAPLSLADWQELYGGGTYKLIVYGPNKRGVHMTAAGTYPSKAMTEPITMTFPGIPSFASIVYDEEEDMSQATQAGYIRGRAPSTVADAKIRETEIAAELTREERQAAREKEQREREEAKQRELEKAQRGATGEVSALARELAQQQAEFRREILEMQERHQQEMRARDERWESKLEAASAKKPERSELDTALLLSKNLNGDSKGATEALEALRAEHARENERTQRQMKDEHDRAEQRVKDERERCDRLIRDADDRAMARIKEVEERHRNLERDLRERSDREIQRAKDEADRRVSDLQHQHTLATASEERNHKRDMDMLTAQHASAVDALKNTYEMRLETARGEVKRTHTDVERWKSEAEKNKDPVAQIKKLKEDAAELGMVDASEAAGSTEPETFGQMMGKAAVGVVQNLPTIVDNVSNMLRGRSAQELQQQRLLGRQEMVDQAAQGFAPPQLPPPHARRRGGAPGLGGGFVPRHMSEVSPMPVGPGADPFVVPPQQVQFQAEAPRAPEPEIVQTTGFPAPSGQGFTNMPPEPQMRPQQAPSQAPPQMQQLASVMPQPSPAPSMPPSPTALAQPGPAPAEIAEDREILQAEQLLLPNYSAGAPPLMVAEGMLQQFGPDVVKNLVTVINPDRVILAIQRSGDPNSPFLRRDGKKYLRAIFDELQKKVSGS